MPDQLPALEEECFVISPIGPEGSPERDRSDEVFKYMIAEAVDELNLVAVRGDQVDEPGQITRQVIDHVLGARAAVADLTFLNPNVFYELAVRHTARLPVALIAEKGSDLPFDLSQMRTIYFDRSSMGSVSECRRQIVAHLRRALEGAVESPVMTSIDVRKLAEGSSADRSIAEILTAVDNLAKVQRTTADEVGWIRQEMRNNSVPPFDTALIRSARNTAFSLAEAISGSDPDREDLLDGIQQILDALDAIHLDGPLHVPMAGMSKRPTIRPRGDTSSSSPDQ